MSGIDKLNRETAVSAQASATRLLPGTVKRMVRAVSIAERNCDRAVDEILTAYQRHGGFETKAEARTWLETKSDPKTIAILRKEAERIADPKERATFLKRLDSPAYRYRMTNRMAVRDAVRISAADISPEVEKALKASTREVVAESKLRTAYNIQRTARVGYDFTMPNRKALESIAGTDYKGLSKSVSADYTDEMQSIIEAGILSGQSTDKIGKQLSEVTGTELWKCKRIARTELSHAANNGSLEEMKELGITKFEFICTLDSERTCDVCGALDGRVFDLDDARTGVNMPPMHPNCRCHIASYMSAEAKRQLTRYAKDPETGKTTYVPRDMTYTEWMKQYAPEEYAKRYGDLSHQVKMDITPKKPKIETTVTVESFSPIFSSTKAERKNTEMMAEYINSRQDANPRVKSLYANMSKMETVESQGLEMKVSHGTGYALSRRWNFDGDLVDAKITIPKMKGPDDAVSAGITLHEEMHLMDFYSRADLKKGSGMFSSSHEGLKKAFKGTDRSMSPEVEALFKEHKAYYDEKAAELNKVWREKTEAARADYKDGKIGYKEYKKRYEDAGKEFKQELNEAVRSFNGGGYGALEDIYDALSRGEFLDKGVVISGHGRSYYRSEAACIEEITAQYAQLSIQRPDLVELLRKDKPELVKALDEMLEDMAGKWEI